MSFNLDKLNMTCAPMYNSQNTNQVLGYMCDSRKNIKEGFESSANSYAYNNSTTYKTNDIIIYNGNSYILPKFIGAAGYNPITHRQYWLPYKPNYDNFKTYKVNDIVTFQNNFYIMKHFIGAAGYAPTGYPQNWSIYDPKNPTSNSPLQRGTQEYRNAFNKLLADPEFSAFQNNFDKTLEKSPQYTAYQNAQIVFTEGYNAAIATVVGDDVCVIPKFNKTAQKLWEKQLATQTPVIVAAAQVYNDAAVIYNNKLIEMVKKYNLPSDKQSLIDQNFYLKDRFEPKLPNIIIDPSYLINIDPSDPIYSNCK
jgi:hypothetical protein